MKIVIAPNAFKGSLSAVEAADAMAAGARKGAPAGEVLLAPVSDGGDGLIEVLARALGGEILEARVTGPGGRMIDAGYLWLDDRKTAVIEMARASGLALLSKKERDPTKTSTRGTGELVAECLQLPLQRLVIGIGGSATCDGGTGLAAALGIRFLDDLGNLFEPVGGSLHKIARIDASGIDPKLMKLAIDVICDVDNPLLGEEGAARVFAPQKGAAPKQVEALEQGLDHLSRLMERDLGIDVSSVKGGGAAGGLGAGLYAFFKAEIRPGVETVQEMVGLGEAMEGADLVLTGEGCLDEQTLFGKAPAGVARLAKERGIPCIALAGRVAGDLDLLRSAGFTHVIPLCRGSVIEREALTKAFPLLAEAAEEALRFHAADS